MLSHSTIDHTIHAIIALVLVIIFQVNYSAISWSLRKLKNDPNSVDLSLKEFMTLNNGLISPRNNGFQCICGCYESRLPDCPPLYDLKDVEESASVSVNKEIDDYMEFAQTTQKRLGEKICNSVESKDEGFEMVTFTGAYCFHYLHKLAASDQEDGGMVDGISLPGSQRTIALPRGLYTASPDLLLSMYNFIDQERIQSITDFGAGIGQYGMALQDFSKTLVYRGYDGAPDVEDYTYGYIKYLDMSSPANVPKSDWVMSLNVGEHIPSNIEGNYIRNLHAHNCRGIILSWATPEQEGMGHVNLHYNEYLIRTFSGLGYIHDKTMSSIFHDALPNKGRDSSFKKSLMILRRIKGIC